MDFLRLPEVPRFRLENLKIPATFLGESGDFAPFALTIEGDRVAEGPAEVTLDLRGRILLPCFTDMHTHLDKGHIWERSPNPDGTFAGALASVRADREARWSAEDVHRRMDFALRAAYAHGTRAIRTHLDSLPPQDSITWPVFREMRQEWRGRIELQAVCLVPVDLVEKEGPFAAIADCVRESGGVLGCVAFPIPDLEDRLETFFRMAEARHLAADFHVDETGDPAAAGLHAIARTVLRSGFEHPVTVGHCCSLAVQGRFEAEHTLDLVAEAGLSVVSLPMCNLYLQDRMAGRTPRWRGVTLVHEMAARGIPVAFASDNTRDPFYAYGDLDMLEVMREATRIAHLDHSKEDWPLAFSTTPADLCGFGLSAFAPGHAADFLIFNARSWTELFARPQSDRILVRDGRQIERRLPDYAELDDLMEAR
ncbi:MAG TPA: cytosine deaminase [Paracoccaceae bacterium]|nr:cytosine deaminase [Paracoccaceae bacterium]